MPRTVKVNGQEHYLDEDTIQQLKAEGYQIEETAEGRRQQAAAVIPAKPAKGAPEENWFTRPIRGTGVPGLVPFKLSPKDLGILGLNISTAALPLPTKLTMLTGLVKGVPKAGKVAKTLQALSILGAAASGEEGLPYNIAGVGAEALAQRIPYLGTLGTLAKNPFGRKLLQYVAEPTIRSAPAIGAMAGTKALMGGTPEEAEKTALLTSAFTAPINILGTLIGAKVKRQLPETTRGATEELKDFLGGRAATAPEEVFPKGRVGEALEPLMEKRADLELAMKASERIEREATEAGKAAVESWEATVGYGTKTVPEAAEDLYQTLRMFKKPGDVTLDPTQLANLRNSWGRIAQFAEQAGPEDLDRTLQLYNEVQGAIRTGVRKTAKISLDDLLKTVGKSEDEIRAMFAPPPGASASVNSTARQKISIALRVRDKITALSNLAEKIAGKTGENAQEVIRTVHKLNLTIGDPKRFNIALGRMPSAVAQSALETVPFGRRAGFLFKSIPIPPARQAAERAAKESARDAGELSVEDKLQHYVNVLRDWRIQRDLNQITQSELNRKFGGLKKFIAITDPEEIAHAIFGPLRGAYEPKEVESLNFAHELITLFPDMQEKISLAFGRHLANTFFDVNTQTMNVSRILNVVELAQSKLDDILGPGARNILLGDPSNPKKPGLLPILAEKIKELAKLRPELLEAEAAKAGTAGASIAKGGAYRRVWGSLFFPFYMLMIFMQGKKYVNYLAADPAGYERLRQWAERPELWGQAGRVIGQRLLADYQNWLKSTNQSYEYKQLPDQGAPGP